MTIRSWAQASRTSLPFGSGFFIVSLNDIDLNRSTCIKVASAGYVVYVVCLKTSSETAKVVLIAALLVEASFVMSRWLRTPEPRFHSHDSDVLKAKNIKNQVPSPTKPPSLAFYRESHVKHFFTNSYRPPHFSKKLPLRGEFGSRSVTASEGGIKELCAKTFAMLGLCVVVVARVDPAFFPSRCESLGDQSISSH